jgi:RNA polymerase sigma-70 factor (ECF subfamily)
MTACVQQFVLNLPATMRTPLVLHDIQEFTNVGMAQVLGCSIEAAKARLHRAPTRLSQVMEERCTQWPQAADRIASLRAPTGGFRTACRASS